MQWREAEHVRKSYRNIRATLLDGAGKFESRIKNLEEQLQIQERDIEELQVSDYILLFVFSTCQNIKIIRCKIYYLNFQAMKNHRIFTNKYLFFVSTILKNYFKFRSASNFNFNSLFIH